MSATPITPMPVGLNFDNTFAREMTGFYADCEPDAASEPSMMRFNLELANDLGLDLQNLNDESLAQIFAGNQIPAGGHWLAQVYAGHQFGGFSEQLGDGRALLIGEVIDMQGQRQDIQLKGSGRTPFSRGGDGKAAVGPVLREYIIGEAMHALGIPTTRALAAVRTGDFVMREQPLPGAVLARVAHSHIRVGTFQFFAARGQIEKLRQLADYVIARHYPTLAQAQNPYQELLRAVRDRQAALVAQWMQVGFIHGVMNTDNMTVSGQTIDYGPCAFMDHYDPQTVFSSIDTQGRYAYANQPGIAQWNLARFAETLLPLIDDDTDKAVELATSDVNAFAAVYESNWLSGMRNKLGLYVEQDDDAVLARDLLSAIDGHRVDYTGIMRALATAADGDLNAAEQWLSTDEARASWQQWHARWLQRLSQEPALAAGERASRMLQVNPLYVARNHEVEKALDAAVNSSDYGPTERLLKAVTNPFTRIDGFDQYAQPAPATGEPYQTFCGT